MAIRFSCSSCGKRVAVRDEAAGRRGRCPQCSGEIIVPMPADDKSVASTDTPGGRLDSFAASDPVAMPASIPSSLMAMANGLDVPPPLPSSIDSIPLVDVQVDPVEAPAVRSSTPPTSAPSAPKSSPARVRRQSALDRPMMPGAGFRAILLILSGIFIWVGLGTSNGSAYYERTYSNRFANDNAYGATANAVEYMAKHTSNGSVTGWLTMALLCWLIASVERLRYTVEIAARRTSPDRAAGIEPRP